MATLAPTAVAREAATTREAQPRTTPAQLANAPQLANVADAVRPVGAQCDLTTTCPTCMIEMQPEHAHYKCPRCGYRDSCCF